MGLFQIVILQQCKSWNGTL